ncbi:MAG: acyl-ACP--UDP-N-acetylglucosamine O-acyltransferase [Actinomycetota bacterium]|nr:acyl-ACP--UDP-N-acetylglucosamine O-acyltransferase [Actinomycetota bacterium]
MAKQQKTSVHPSAIVHKSASISENVSIGPFCIIGEGVKIGPGCKLANNVIVEGDTVIGPNCVIHPFAGIGLPPQDLKYRGERTGVTIGANNVIREYVSIHRGSVGGGGRTVLGDNNFIMAYAHVAHDNVIGNNVIITNAATLGGHVEVQDHAIIGGVVAVHQFTRIGSYSMTGGFSGIGQDIPPYTMASGPRAKLYGLNLVGLRRHGFSRETINELTRAYKILFRSKHTLKEAVKKIREDLPRSAEIETLVEFVLSSKRGICRPSASKTALPF